jgi:hypothetical protein
MVRTQIQLPEEQVAALKNIAAAHHTSMAEIIRQSIDMLIKTKIGRADRQLREKAMAAAGQFKSGVKDLAGNHDSYLAQITGK